MKKNYFKKELTVFLNSFKLKFNFIQILLFDLIFFAITVPGIYLVSLMINKKGAEIDTAMLTQEALIGASEAELQLLTSQMQGLIAWTIASFVILALIILITWSITRCLIYGNLLKKKVTPTYFKKTIGFTLILSIIFIILVPFIAALVKTQTMFFAYFSLAIFLALIYFAVLSYIQLTKKNKVFASIRKGIEFGAKNFKKLLLPIILILVVGYIINQILALLPKSQKLTVIFILVLAAYMAWARIYFVDRVK